MAYPSTFVDLQNGVIAKARLDPVADLSRVKDWINQAYYDAVVETRCLQQTSTTQMTAGVSTYALDPSVLHLILLTVTQVGANAWFPLRESSLDEILNWRARGSAAVGPATRYALVGLYQMEVWPTPNTNDTMTVWYTALPTPLVADADKPQIPEPFASKLLEYGALEQAAEFKRDIMVLGDYQAQKASWMQAFQRYVNRKPGEYPEAFPTWTRMNPFAPHDPSSDVPSLDYR